MQYGIRRIIDNLWFGGFGPAPTYEVRWFPEDCAYGFDSKDTAEMQAYLLDRFKSAALSTRGITPDPAEDASAADHFNQGDNMATDNERLHTVNKMNFFKTVLKVWVFRTRAAANAFAREQRKKSRNASISYKVGPATWGPEM